jgi:hypothetical protein
MRGTVMAGKDLIGAILKRFKGMKQQERIATIRELASGSAEDEAFARDFFPELYREALPR